jgi:S-adenosylmethionine hydrolase
MILLFTDFGREGPYVGELHAVLARAAPTVRVIDLMHDAPRFRPELAAYLLAALVERVRPGEVVVAVVDPGVGGERAPVILEADGVTLVGPDNGLLEIVRRRAKAARARRIDWRPERLSASFHGRDLFAPVAAALARGEPVATSPIELTPQPRWPDDLPAIIHVDGFGNLVTGLRAATLPDDRRIRFHSKKLRRGRTFGDVEYGQALVYANSLGLLEIAVNQGSAADTFELGLGDPVELGPA